MKKCLRGSYWCGGTVLLLPQPKKSYKVGNAFSADFSHTPKIRLAQSVFHCFIFHSHPVRQHPGIRVQTT